MLSSQVIVEFVIMFRGNFTDGRPQSNNGVDQPAAGEEVSNSETPDPSLGCNGLFVVFGFHKGRFEAVCRRAASCAIANMSPSNRSEISNRILWISSIVLSAFVGFIA
jgi:hypothetical protein